MEALFKALGAGLSLWNTKEKKEYLSVYMKLKEDWYDEYKKDIMDDAVLDDLEFRMHNLVDSFASQVAASYTKD